MKLVLTSDLHGSLPNLPSGDVLLVAGDLCPDFIARAPQRAWFVDKFLPWTEKWGFGAALATFGNHDWLPNPSKEWADLVGSHVIKIDELVEINHPCDCGFYPGCPDDCDSHRTPLKVWFSPWSNQFGAWAWMDQPYNLGNKYAIIPEGVDIIVSHQPPFGYGDVPDPKYYIGAGREHVGSHELLHAIDRVKPKLVVCGHIHGGYGSYERGPTTIMNVAQMNEAYEPVNAPVVLDWDEFTKEK